MIRNLKYVILASLLLFLEASLNAQDSDISSYLNSSPDIVYSVQSTLSDLAHVDESSTQDAMLRFANNNQAEYCGVFLTSPSQVNDKAKGFINFLTSVFAANNLSDSEKIDFLKCAYPKGYSAFRGFLVYYKNRNNDLVKTIKENFINKVNAMSQYNAAQNQYSDNGMGMMDISYRSNGNSGYYNNGNPNYPPNGYIQRRNNYPQSQNMGSIPQQPGNNNYQGYSDNQTDQYDDTGNNSKNSVFSDGTFFNFLRTNGVFYRTVENVFQNDIGIDANTFHKIALKFATNGSNGYCNISMAKFSTIQDKLKSFLSFMMSIMMTPALQDIDKMQIMSCVFDNDLDSLMRNAVFFQNSPQYAAVLLENHIIEDLREDDSYLKASDDVNGVLGISDTPSSPVKKRRPRPGAKDQAQAQQGNPKDPRAAAARKRKRPTGGAAVSTKFIPVQSLAPTDVIDPSLLGSNAGKKKKPTRRRPKPS